VQPQSIPSQIANLNEQPIAAAPDIDGVPGGTETTRRGGEVWRSIGNNPDVAPPTPAPAPTHPIIVSRWAEGNLIYRVQPVYPPLARQARIQGTVQVRAIISKLGTIENLQAISGHPMLVPSARNAVRQWRYRPYMLNGEAIEIETEITVNFVLTGN
jgi:protein TonB